MKFALKKSNDQKLTRSRPTRNSSTIKIFSYSSGSNTARADQTQPRRLTKRDSEKLQAMRKAVPRMSTNTLSRVTSLVSIVLLLLSFYFLLSLHRSATVLIAKSNIQGASSEQRLTDQQLIYRTKAQYEDVVQSAVNDNFANKYKLTINEEAIEAKVREQLPEVKDVSIAISLFSQRPRIGLVLSDIAFRALDSEGRGYIVTENGVVLSMNSNLKEAAEEVPLLTTAYSLKEQEQKAYFTVSEIAFMRYVAQELGSTGVEQGGVALESFLLPPEVGEVDIKIQQRSFVVKMSYFEDPETQVGALKAVLQELGRGGAQPEAYIDVRLAEKVYVK